jgi:hypothetical protein
MKRFLACSLSRTCLSGEPGVGNCEPHFWGLLRTLCLWGLEISVALMEQNFLMVEFLLQPPHDDVADLVSIAQSNHSLAFGGDHRQARPQMCRGNRGWRTIQSCQFVRDHFAQLRRRFALACFFGREALELVGGKEEDTEERHARTTSIRAGAEAPS